MQEENNDKQKRITERLALSVRALTGVIAVLLGVIVFLSYLVVYGWPETEKIIVQNNSAPGETNTIPLILRAGLRETAGNCSVTGVILSRTLRITWDRTEKYPQAATA
ncbi:MAG: hypothetical protein FD123_3077 [Bacteroidetes bacterium]|nr:MAG: hypothetical protein FD123_3077 [Bacteroidota bacterium]